MLPEGFELGAPTRTKFNHERSTGPNISALRSSRYGCSNKVLG